MGSLGIKSLTYTVATKLQHLTNEITSRVWSALAGVTFPEKRDRINLVSRIRHDRRMLATSQDAWIIASLAKSCARVEGDVAEVGSFQGATASLIANVLPDKTVYAFDAYDDGLPDPSNAESGEYWARKGNMSSSYQDAREYLSRWRNVKPIKGYFPQSANGASGCRFAFVHLDVDMYESTRDSLAWFYPRMSRGGILLTHDWNLCPGVSKAFEEVMHDKPESIIELPTNQAFFVKL